MNAVHESRVPDCLNESVGFGQWRPMNCASKDSKLLPNVFSFNSFVCLFFKCVVLLYVTELFFQPMLGFKRKEKEKKFLLHIKLTESVNRLQSVTVQNRSPENTIEVHDCVCVCLPACLTQGSALHTLTGQVVERWHPKKRQRDKGQNTFLKVKTTSKFKQKGHTKWKVSNTAACARTQE